MAGRRAFGSIRQLSSGRFQARYQGPDLAEHKAPRTFAQKRTAEGWLASEDRLIANGGWVDPARRAAAEESRGLTVGEYVERVITRRQKRARKPLSHTTADLYRKDWKNVGSDALGHMLLSDLTPTVIGSWWDSLGSTPTQDGRCYDLLKSVLAEAVEDELLDKNPCRVRGAGKPAPKRRGQALTVAEGRAYVAAVPESSRLALMTALWCGLRSGEVRGLRRADVDLDRGVLRVEQAVSRVRRDETSFEWRIDGPKTAAGRRSVAMPAVMIEPLRSWMEAMVLQVPTALVFPALGDPARPMHESVLRHAHEKGREAIGQSSLTIHDLRRTAATLAAQGGATTAELMALLGHTTVAMAMVYQVATDERDRARAGRLDAAIEAAV